MILIPILISGILLSCKEQGSNITNSSANVKTATSVKNKTITNDYVENNHENEFFIGKKYYADEELTNYQFVKSFETNIDRLQFYLYKDIKSGTLVATLNKVISKEDIAQFQIIDVIKITSNTDNVDLVTNVKNGNTVLILEQDGRKIKKWLFSSSELGLRSSSERTKFDHLSPTLSFSISPTKEKNKNVPSEFKIKIQNKSNLDVLDEFYYVPEYLFEQIESGDAVSYIGKLDTNEGIENYHKFIVADFNFDNKEDIAIINYEGNNAGPQFNYYLQTTNGEFLMDTFLSQDFRFFPKKINPSDRSLMISHPIGCCAIETIKIQLQSDHRWKEIFHETQSMNK